MKYQIQAPDVIKALAGMSKIGKNSFLGTNAKTASKVRVQFDEGRLILSRADREQLIEFAIPAQGSGSGMVCLDVEKFGGYIKNVDPSRAVDLVYDPENACVNLRQGAGSKAKLPVVSNDNRVPFAQPADVVASVVSDEDATRFFAALARASTFCVEKIVGRGKFPGVVIHGDRIVAASHEGAFSATAPIGITGYFGIPSTVVWTLLNLKGATSLSVSYGAGVVAAGQVKSALISGVSGGLPWVCEFASNQPFHTFAGIDLLKPMATPALSFEAVFQEAGYLVQGLSTASAVQSRTDVWIEFAQFSEGGVFIRGTDVAKTVESSCSAPFQSFSGVVPDVSIQVKKAGLLELLSTFEAGVPVSLGFDDKGSKMVLRHGADTGFLSCTLGD